MIRKSAFITFCLIVNAAVSAGSLPDGPYVSTSAEAQVELQADFAEIRVAGRYKGQTDDQARSGIIEIQQALLEAIDPFKNNVEPLKLDSLDSTADERWDGDNLIQVGFVDSFDVSIKVIDLTILDDIFHQLSIVEGINVRSPTFFVDDSESAQAEARDQALTEARAEAAALAKSQGASLGQIWGIVYRAKHNEADPINWSGIFQDTVSEVSELGRVQVTGSRIYAPIELDRQRVVYQAEVAVVYELVPDGQSSN